VEFLTVSSYQRIMSEGKLRTAVDIIMAKQMRLAWVLTISMSLLSCSKSLPLAKVENSGQQPPGPTSAPADPRGAQQIAAPTNASPAAASSGNDAHGVKTEMRQVMFHLTPTAAARLIVVSGELWPTGTNEMVVFDDKKSFEVRVTNGAISITAGALTDIMNNYVFAKKDAPLKDLTIEINQDNGRLIIKGKLHSKGDLSFGTEGTLSVNDDGRIRVHTEKITAMKVPVKGLMGLFGVELANVVNTSKIDGIDTDENDLLMDLGTLLPPPHIRGKLTEVRVERDAIVAIFGDGGKSFPEPEEKTSFMALSGNRAKFGKLVMEPTDLTVLDLDPKSVLDWNQDHYKEQLEAGYSKITSKFGLRAYAKDYGKLPKSSAALEEKAAGRQGSGMEEKGEGSRERIALAGAVNLRRRPFHGCPPHHDAE
jgi:hypothetical protein